MARSGTIRSNTVGDYSYGLAIDWSITSQSTINNSSTISYKVYGINASGGNGWAEYKNISVSIEGDNVYSTSSHPNVRKGTVIKYGTITIPHNQDGNKNVLFKVSAYVWESGNISINQNVSLDKINRGIYDVSLASGWDKLNGDKTITFKKYDSSVIVKVLYAWWDYKRNKKTYRSYFDNNLKGAYSSGNSINFNNNLSEIKNSSYNRTYAWIYIELEVYTSDGNTLINKHKFEKQLNLEARQPKIDISFDRKGYGFKLIKSNQILNNQHELIIKSSPKAYDGASIKDTYIEFQGMKKKGTTAKFISTKTGLYNATVTTTDTRGYTVKNSVKINVLPYKKPKLLNFSAYRYRGGEIDVSGSDVKIKGTIEYDTALTGNRPMWKIEPASSHTITKDILYATNLPVSESKTYTLIWGDSVVEYKRIITINKSEFPFVLGQKSVGINYFPKETDQGLFVSGFGGGTNRYVGFFDGYVKTKGINTLRIEDISTGTKISNYKNSKGLGLLLKETDIYYTYDGKDYSLWPSVKNNTSDKKLKKNIKKTKHKAMNIIDSLEFKEYDWIDGPFHQVHTNIGLIAQDIQKIDESLVYKDGDILKLDLLRLISISLKGIKELQEEIKELKEKIQNEKNKRT
ncbi:tail fiber domain-containing protein [Helcococcus ovis]|uniref:tail fiber domain-containing protein n=1 Tax=Helcococcus TaxID=31983 RepID=UPI0038B8B028